MAMKLKVKYGIDPEGRGNSFFCPTWPQKRSELMTAKRGNPSVFQSTYQCNPGAREGTIFLESDFNFFNPHEEIEQGYGNKHVRAYLEGFDRIICAWDTAFEATSEADYTVCVTAGLLPCHHYHRGESEDDYGPCEDHFDVYLLNVYREKVEWGDLILTFREQHQLWRPNLHVVEKKGSGISLYQSLARAGIEVLGVEARESKRARAVDGTEAGSVQGWFKRHRVLMPHEAPWLKAYKQEMKNFSGADGGRDDQVDATVHLVNHAIQEGTGMALLPTGWNPDVQNAAMANVGADAWLPSDNIAMLSPGEQIARNWSLFSQLGDYAQDPFDGTCDRCAHRNRPSCPYNGQIMLSLDGCGAFQSKGDQQGCIT